MARPTLDQRPAIALFQIHTPERFIENPTKGRATLIHLCFHQCIFEEILTLVDPKSLGQSR